MKTKGELPILALQRRENVSSVSTFISGYFELNGLKQLYRQGWLKRGIPPEQCESVAEHVFSMAMLGWWIADDQYPELDRDKVLRMTLIHELGEIYIGDITPSDLISREEKHRLEREGFLKVVEKFTHWEEYLELWEEFEAGNTEEARFVRQLDRLEMAFQAAVYERQGAGNLEEFFITTDEAVTDPKLKEIFHLLLALRVA